MNDEYSAEQKAKIAKHFVLVAPHGEINELVKDLQQVVPSNILTEKWLIDSLSGYNKRRFAIFEGDSTKVICCPQAEVAPNKYLNPNKNVVCVVDPVKQRIISVNQASSITSKYQNYRTAINDELQQYLKAYYEDGTTPNSYAKGMGSVYVSANGKLAIVISFKNLNKSNYWTGGWQSEWTLSVSQTGETKLEGRIRLNVHYYEDGNVQLNSTLNEGCDVRIGNADDTAVNVVKNIQVLESKFQKRLDEFYVQMNKSTFKNMRRFLPKTATRMDWRVGKHSLVAEAAGTGN